LDFQKVLAVIAAYCHYGQVVAIRDGENTMAIHKFILDLKDKVQVFWKEAEYSLMMQKPSICYENFYQKFFKI